MKDLNFAEYQEKYKEDLRFLCGFHNGNGLKYQHEAKDYVEYIVLVYAENIPFKE